MATTACIVFRMTQKKKRTPAKKKAPARKNQPLRYAAPSVAGPYGTQLLDHIENTLAKVPKAAGSSIMTLAQVIGQDGASGITASGKMLFHCVGDTGNKPDSPQSKVADAMTTDYDVHKPNESPAFFFHLGDVIYGHDKDELYRREYYEPYVHYPGKIVAIPGNHDGQTYPKTDPVSLRAFLANFCAASQTVSPVAGPIFRQTMNQPGVYWLLDAPFVWIVGLYSNVAEGPGFIRGTIPTSVQFDWLVATLKTIKSKRDGGDRRKIVMATHHPPYTKGGHSPSSAMLKDLDDACTQAGIMPDLFLSGHAHSYQRYTRRLTFGGRPVAIPYVVAGCGGVADQAVPAATGQVEGQATFEKSRQGYGYLLLQVDASTITGTCYAVDQTTGAKTRFDTFTA
jgi:hypothetical protein